MNVREIEARPRPHRQPSIICVPGHGSAVTYTSALAGAMAKAVLDMLRGER